MGRAEKGSFFKKLRPISDNEILTHVFSTITYQSLSYINKHPIYIPGKDDEGMRLATLFSFGATFLADALTGLEAKNRTQRKEHKLGVLALEQAGVFLFGNGANLAVASYIYNEPKGIALGVSGVVVGASLLAIGEKIRQDGYLFRRKTTSKGE